MKFWNSNTRYGICFGAALTVFTAYTLLDTFVLPRSYAEMEEPPSSAAEVMPKEYALTDTCYKDENMTITLTRHRDYDTEIYVVDVVVNDPSYLQRGFADDTYGRNIKDQTSDIAEEYGAIFAVNGDFYGAQTEGYVIADGVIYRDEPAEDREDLAIMEDGSFMVFQERDIAADALLEQGVRHVLSFGPALFHDGEIMVTAREEVGRAKESNPRTAIGIYDPLHYVFVCSDGRTEESKGLSLHQLAEFMQGLGVTTAYNLDGGGSATMCFAGEIVNKPTANGRDFEERRVSDIVYVGYGR